MLSLQSTQQLLRALGTHHLSLYMENRLGYLFMLLWEIRVRYLLLLTLYSTSSSLSRMPRIISSEPKSIRSATSTSTTTYRSIRWEKKVLLSSKTLHLAGTRKLQARFVGSFRVLERVGKTACRLDLRGRFKDVHNVFHVSWLCKHSPGGSSANPPEPI